MAEITGQSLIQDWYDRYVLPKKQMKDTLSGVKPDFSMGNPPSTSPMGYKGPGIAGPTSFAPPGTAALPQAPSEPSPEDQLRAEFNLDEAEGNQDTFTEPALDADPTPAKPSGWDNLREGMKDPLKVGVLGMGLSMMATPPRAMKYSGAEIIGKAGLSGLGIYEKALETKRRERALDLSAEEHKLTREDRALAARERADYWKEKIVDTKERTGILASTAESAAALRTAQAEAKTRDEAPIGENTYGIDPKMPMWKVDKLKGLQKQENAPIKKDAFNTWLETFPEGTFPTRKEIEEWHRTQSGSGGADGPGKSAAITHINRELVTQYLDKARDNISSKAPAGSAEMKAMLDSLNVQDPLTGGPNESKVRESLNADQRKEYDFVKRQAQKNSTTMVPAEAVAQAQSEWNKQNPPKKAAASGSGYDDFKRVYQSIVDYQGWDNKTKNEKIRALNEKARKNGVIK